MKLGRYRHYKGHLYDVIGLAKHSETLEDMVVYRALYSDDQFGDNAMWVRPVSMFSETVSVDGGVVPRFQYLPKIYVGCALTQAPAEFRLQVADFKNTLRSQYHVLDFVGLEQGSDTDVFHHDSDCVRSCDLFLAICDYPAIGLGYELGLALALGKSVLAVAHEQSKVSRLVLGVDNSNYSFHRYQNFSDISLLLPSFFHPEQISAHHLLSSDNK